MGITLNLSTPTLKITVLSHDIDRRTALPLPSPSGRGIKGEGQTSSPRPLSPLPRAAETQSLAAHGASLGQGEGQTGSPRGGSPLAPVQKRFDFGPLAVAPLWSINGVMGILRREAEDILALIDDGKLPWAWDIATRGPHASGRAEWRIWSECVRAYQLNHSTHLTDLTHAEVLTRLLGHSRPVLRAAEIRSVWTCDRNTIHRHIDLGNLELDPSSPRLGSSNKTCRIPRASFEQFMFVRCANPCSRRGHEALITTGGKV